MLIKMICCDVFTRLACDLVAKSPHVIDIEFLPMLAHVEPDRLRQTIADRIEAIGESGRSYDALILGFGLCGNSTVGLTCSIPMVIPRVHDCCTVFMGGKERFLEVFGNALSSRWCNTGYWERTWSPNSGYPVLEQQDSYKTSEQYMNFLAEYDEETAEFLWQTMFPTIETHDAYYIEQEGFEFSGAYEGFKSFVEREDITLHKVDGGLDLMQALIFGEWDDERFLVVPPGMKIAGVYDMDKVMRAEEVVIVEKDPFLG